MNTLKWIVVPALGISLVSGSPSLAQGNGQGKGHDKHHEDEDRLAKRIAMSITRRPFVAGTRKAKTIFRQVSQRRIVCLPASKSS